VRAEIPELSAAQKQVLQALVCARGPAGQEEEVAAVCRQQLEPVCDEVWEDATGNLVSVIRARRPRAGAGALRVLAHMDEIALIVKRVEADGGLRVVKLGGLQPMSFGQCPVDILGDETIVPGVLAIGSLHVTKETANLNQRSPDDIGWEDMFITTRLSREELLARGVHAGCRVVVGQYMRRLFEFEDCIATHFMDDRALILAGVEMMKSIRAQAELLARDVYFVCTVKEEVTNSGALYAVKNLPGDDLIALEVGPVAGEYDTHLSKDPIVLYGDMKGFYSKRLCDALRSAAAAEGLAPQLALFENFASDASAVLSLGEACRAAALCVPTQNTHGFEIIHKAAVNAAALTLSRYVQRSCCG